MCRDRCAPRGKFVENAHVEVAVHGHRCGSWDRRRGHDERVGYRPIDGLVAQCGTLLHAKSVLLIHHDHSEAVKVDTFLDQCVRADHEVDRAIGQTRKHVSTVPGWS